MVDERVMVVMWFVSVLIKAFKKKRSKIIQPKDGLDLFFNIMNWFFFFWFSWGLRGGGYEHSSLNIVIQYKITVYGLHTEIDVINMTSNDRTWMRWLTVLWDWWLYRLSHSMRKPNQFNSKRRCESRRTKRRRRDSFWQMPLGKCFRLQRGWGR